MSEEAVRWVLDALDISRAEKYVLLAYAQLASVDPEVIIAPVSRVARMTGYSQRQIRALTAVLERNSLLLRVGTGEMGAVAWNLNRAWQPRSVSPAAWSPKGHGQLYLMRSGNLFKIGLSTNSRRRLKSVRSPFGGKVELLATKPSAHMLAEERRLHERFADLRVTGEWFLLGEAEVSCLLAEFA